MLGLSEEEFWGSTLAKVTALYRIQQEWCRTRDFFPAQIAAVGLNSTRTQATDKAWSAEEILLARYPKEADPTPPHDPDHGAQGNWRHLKAALKGVTAAKAQGRPSPHG